MKPNPATRVIGAITCFLVLMLIVSCSGNEHVILGTWSYPGYTLEFLKDGNGIFTDDRDQLGSSYELLEGDRLLLDYGLGRPLTGPSGKGIGFVDVANRMLIFRDATGCAKRTN